MTMCWHGANPFCSKMTISILKIAIFEWKLLKKKYVLMNFYDFLVFFDNKPVWVRTCLFRSNESLNPLLQYAHLYFLYGEWFRRWRLSIRTCLKHLPQISHLNSEPWLWPPWTEPDPHEGDIECLWWWFRLADGWNFELDMSHMSESFCMISFGRLSKRS